MVLWEGLYTSGVLLVCIVLLLKNVAPPDAVMAGGLGVLLVASVVPTEDALEGVSNESLLTVVVLFIVAAGISDTGGLDHLFQKLLGNPKSLVAAQLRVLVPVAVISAFFNNTVRISLSRAVLNNECSLLSVRHRAVDLICYTGKGSARCGSADMLQYTGLCAFVVLCV